MKAIYYKVGDNITIYKDPITRKHVEDVARLLSFVCKDENGLEDWEVEFPSDPGHIVTRSVMPRF